MNLNLYFTWCIYKMNVYNNCEDNWCLNIATLFIITRVHDKLLILWLCLDFKILKILKFYLDILNSIILVDNYGNYNYYNIEFNTFYLLWSDRKVPLVPSKLCAIEVYTHQNLRLTWVRNRLLRLSHCCHERNIVPTLFYDELAWDLFIVRTVYGLHLRVHERRTRQDRRGV